MMTFENFYNKHADAVAKRKYAKQYTQLMYDQLCGVENELIMDYDDYLQEHV